MVHIPVLQKEVTKYLDPSQNENFIDCTIGGGGHAEEIMKRNGPDGKLLGIDRDEEQIENLRIKFKNFGNRVILEAGNYADLKEIIKKSNFKNISGIILDLGFSSWHVDESKRGFTFLKNEELDMRYDTKAQLTAAKILNYSSGADIERILREYGQESCSKQIAKEIVAARRIKAIENTFQLVEIIKRAVPGGYLRGKINFATKTFQALRIAVNDELGNLERVLPQAMDSLRAGGRLTVISFHSLEDVIVKKFFKDEFNRGRAEILTKKPQIPNREELIINPRARSAKLRAIKKK